MAAVSYRPNEEKPSAHFAASRRTEVSWGASTSVGHVRLDNQDRWGHAHGKRFVVADGMGGTNGGAIAARVAVSEFLSSPLLSGGVIEPALRNINETVRQETSSLGLQGAGTTLVGVLVHGSAFTAVSAGDSRLYRRRGHKVELLTTDHTLRNLRISEGLAPDTPDPRGRPDALTSYFGSQDRYHQIDIRVFEAEPQDRLLLCTDGVHGQIPPSALTQILLSPGDSATTADLLVRAADLAGGHDNATALVIDYQGYLP